MSPIKVIFAGAAALLLTATSAYAGRIMELEHLRAIEQVKKARAEAKLNAGEGVQGQRGEERVKTFHGKFPQRTPFKYSH
ncbi:MAG: hypothetical protein ACREV0_07825 [Burkholderiales bacterium]